MGCTRNAQAGWNAFAVFQATRRAKEESDFVSVVIRLSRAQDPQWRELYEWVFGSGAEDGAQSRLMAKGSQKSS